MRIHLEYFLPVTRDRSINHQGLHAWVDTAARGSECSLVQPSQQYKQSLCRSLEGNCMLGRSLEFLLAALTNPRINRNRARQWIQREYFYWKTILMAVCCKLWRASRTETHFSSLISARIAALMIAESSYLWLSQRKWYYFTLNSPCSHSARTGAVGLLAARKWGLRECRVPVRCSSSLTSCAEVQLNPQWRRAVSHTWAMPAALFPLFI